MANKKQTSPKVAKVASEILRDPEAAKTVAASDLSQAEAKPKKKK